MANILWSNDDVIFKDGDVVWKPHETDVQAISLASSNISGSLDSQPGCISSIAGTSGVDASLDSQPELIGIIAGISGALGNLIGIWTNRGSTAGISGAFGSLDSQPGCVSSIAGTSGVLGSLDSQPGCVSSIVGTSGAFGSLSVSTELGSSVVEISGAAASLGSLEVATKLQGSIAGTSGSDASLDLQPELIGSTAGISGADGFLNFLIALQGSIVGTSGAFGSLLVSTELGSSVVEISGASASLGSIEVATLLEGSTAGISGIDASLDSQPELIGSTAETSGSNASLDSQPGCISSVAGTSNLPDDTNYLSIIPDFEAATLFWRPENNILETLEWKTSVLQAHDGTEQRIKVRQSPRQYFKLQLMLETNKINTRFDSVLHTWQKQDWLIPVWTEYVNHTTDIDSHDTVIIVNTTNADFRNGGKAIIWKSPTDYEVIVIDTKTDSQLNLSYSVLNSFSGAKYIIPVRTAHLISSSKKEKSNADISIVDLTFAVHDNTTIDGYVPDANYDGLEVLDTPAYMDRTHSEISDADIYITDFETGIFKVVSNSNFNFLTQSHNFFSDTKEACWNFRKFLYSLNGRQKAILIPTFRDDIIQSEDIGLLEVTVKIENIGLAENMSFNSLRTYIGFYFSATNNLVVRKITAITELDSTEEQITFDANLGLAFIAKSENCKICFVDKCRLGSDRIQIKWPYAHRNECQTNFMRVS